MATEIGELRARMIADSQQFKAELRQVKQYLKEQSAEAKAAASSFDGLNEALANVGLNAQQIKKIGDAVRNANPQILERQLQAVRDQLRLLGVDAKQIEKIEEEMKQARTETEKTEKSMHDFGSAIAAIGAGATFAKLTTTIKSLADEAQQLSMAYSGLSEVSKALNIDVEKSAALADELADRWGLSRTEMANTVKTYLTAGLTLEQTRNIMIATADAAVYNRQANLSWSEAIQQVAQGIKMGNSDLTDAAGITTNLSVMYDRYAKSIGTTAAKLTEAQKIQAAYNGMLQEGAIFAGNADSAMTGYTGTQATFNQTLQTARVELGEAFLPVLEDVMETVTPLIRQFALFADGNKEVVAGIAAATTAFTAFIAVVGGLATAFTVLKSVMGGWVTIITLIGAAAGGIWAYQQAADAAAESVWKFAQNQDELNKKLSESPLSRSADDVKKLKEDIDTLNELLEKRKSLQEELNKLNDERNAKLISNESGAEIYKLDRQISDLKDNLSEVDKQLSQLGINTPEDAPRVLQKLNDQLNASIPALMKLEEANLRDAAAQIKHIDSVNQLVKQYEKLDKQTKLTVEQKNQLTQVVKQLQQEYPGLQTQLDEEGRWHIRNTDLLHDLIDAEKSSVNEATAASKKRLEAWRAETQAKLQLAKQQVQALMAVAGTDFSETKIGSKLPAGLSKAIDFVGDITARGLAAKAQENANQYQVTINEIDKQIAAITSGTLDKYFDTPATGAAGDDKKKSKKKEKTLAEIQQDQYQQALKFIQYKRDMNQMSEQEELVSLKRLEERYKKNGEIRMDVEVRIKKLQDQMAADSKKRSEDEAKARFEASSEWIEQEERRMTLAGKSEDEITQMKLDAWTRVRNRYEKDSDFYKQADTQVYNLKVSLIKSAQKAQEEAAKQQEQDTQDLLKSTLDAINKQKQAELDALDERRKAIEDFYADQEAAIDDAERQRERDNLNAEIAKYKYATSEQGQKHLQELQEKLRQMDVEDQKRALDKERDQKLEALDKQKDDIESWYDDLENIISDYKGDAIKIFKALEDDRYKAFKTTNDKIRAELQALIQEYASLNLKTASKPSGSGSSGNSSTSPTPIPNGTVGTSAATASSAAIVAQMQANSAAWKTASTTERKALEAANEKLGASLGATKNSATGKWTDVNGNPLYHTGGIAGLMNFRSGDELLPNELAAILKVGEPVLTPQQISSLVGAGAGSGDTIINYNAPLIEHNGDIRLEDEADIKTYNREQESLVRRLYAKGGRLDD
jgi:hypothetical protein